MKRLLLVAFILGVALCGAGETLAADTGDLDKALAYYHTGRFGEAARYLQEYVDQRPDPKGYYLLGYALYKLKRFSEAEDYFAQAYLIDPTFSPEGAGLPKPPVRKKAGKKDARSAVPGAAGEAPTQQAPAAGLTQKDSQKPSPPTPSAPAEAKQAAKPGPAPSVPPGSAAAAPSAPKASQQTPQAPAPTPSPLQPQSTMPQFPPAVKQPMPMPGMGPGLITGIVAGLGTFVLLLGLVFYLFCAYCLYRIAVRLNVPAAWTAWVPLLQLWAIVGSACKPWWWILLLFVPLLNMFIAIYLWICISENLGHNKWLGLLMLVPAINLLFMAYLAFAAPAAASPSLGESVAEDLA